MEKRSQRTVLAEKIVELDEEGAYQDLVSWITKHIKKGRRVLCLVFPNNDGKIVATNVLDEIGSCYAVAPIPCVVEKFRLIRFKESCQDFEENEAFDMIQAQYVVELSVDNGKVLYQCVEHG